MFNCFLSVFVSVQVSDAYANVLSIIVFFRHDSVRREALYNILIEFGIPRKLVRLIKMCLTEMYSRVRAGKNLSEMFPIRNGLKQGDALLPLLFNFALE